MSIGAATLGMVNLHFSLLFVLNGLRVVIVVSAALNDFVHPLPCHNASCPIVVDKSVDRFLLLCLIPRNAKDVPSTSP